MLRPRLVPPSPGTLLGISPGQHGYPVRVVSHGVNRVAFIEQGSGRPQLMIVEILKAVLLHLESQVYAPEHLNRLLLSVAYFGNFFVPRLGADHRPSRED